MSTTFTFTKLETLRLRRKPESISVQEPISSRLLNFEDIPPWYQDNPCVRSGYRAISHSTTACIESWSYIHNESINIFTHLLPAITILFVHKIIKYRLGQRFPDATPTDLVIFDINLLAATICLSLSASYHTLMNHSFPMSSLWLRIDYVGILTLILGSFISGIYVGFLCEPFLQKTYWSMIITLSIVTSILVLHPRLQGVKYRSHRTIAFVATGLSGFAPVIHGLCRYGWDEMWVRSGMPYWFLEGVVYGIGAFFFVTRIPESRYPGKFDIWGASHQIFHVLVVAGAVVHLMGVWEAYKWNYTNNRCCVTR